MKINLLIIFLMINLGLFAQNGTIKGIVSDSTSQELLVGVTIAVFNQDDATRQMITGTSTDLDGNYEISLEPGKYLFAVSYVSYNSKDLPVEVVSGQALSKNISLLESSYELKAVEVIAKVSRESENILLMDQKKASVSVESIGANQMKAQGVSNAAAGVAKVTGISKQSGSYTLNVRGLGDRYNTTTMNGLPLPSNHAEYKNINLELFSTDIIGYIGVEKVFTSKLFGDVAGANINLVSKQHQEDPYIKIGLGSGYNSNLFSNSDFFLQDGPGLWGFDNFSHPTSDNVPDNYNVFENKWNPVSKTANPNFEGSLMGGKKFEFANGSSLSLFVNASFDNDYGYSEKIENKVNGSDVYRIELKGKEYWYNTQSTGMLNLNYSFKKNEIYFNSMILNSSSQDMNQLEGYIIDIVGDKDQESALLRRSNYERNLIYVNQLLGKHKLNSSTEINWALAHNNIANTLPDRRHNIFVLNKNSGVYVASTNDQANNHRYWHELDESEMALNLSISKELGKGKNNLDYVLKLTAGYNGRIKQRDFNSYQYNHRINRDHYNDPIDPWNVDAYFNDANYQAGFFSLKTFYSTLNLPVNYSGLQRIHTGFVYGEYNLNSRFLVVLGLRGENVYQNVDFKTTLKTGSNFFDKFYILPSISLRYKATEKSNIRLSASQTYTLPQFKERAPIQFEGITFSSIGNDYLVPSTNYNLDLKWELFSNPGELISATVFGKYILDPINQFVMSSASNDFTYANTGNWAYVYGLELDFRKNIINISRGDYSQKLFAGANLSLMKTEQELSNEKVSQDTKGEYIASFVVDREVLQGAAPVLANASIGYERNWNDDRNSISATLVYAYTSDRLYLLGYAGEIGNQIDQAYSDLDFILKTTFNRLEITAKVQNILNPKITRIQRNKEIDHVVMQYQEGMQFGLSLSYKL